MTFVSYIVPPALGYFAMATLAVTPQTHTLRMAVWPIVTSLALRAAVSVDMSLGEPDQKFRNTLFVFSMLFIATRTLDWTLAKGPLVRHVRPTKDSRSIVMDALDLALALRGHGWDWSSGVYIPRETRPASRAGFIFHVLLSAAFHSLICGTLHIAIRSFSPTGLGTLSGGTIFDDTLPFHVRYLRACIITLVAAFAIYALIQTCYDVSTITAVLVFGQDPAQWPPAFDAPWLATSMSEFWGRRWHQFFRRLFLTQGGYPLSLLLGRVGRVTGAFLSSGVLHHIAMASLNDQLEPWSIPGGFTMMAPVVLAEWAFKRVTGRKVDGVAGWIWTMAWLLLWGSVLVDAHGRAGVFAYFDFTESVVPGRAVVERMVANFDALLHAM